MGQQEDAVTSSTNAHEAEDEILSLPDAYARAAALADQHQASPSEGTAARALSLLDRCQRLVEGAALFSANEERDDIATPHLKYLLVPAMQAEILSTARAFDSSIRSGQVDAAMEASSRFMQRCEQYGLLSSELQKAWHAAEEGAAQDAHSRRTSKIDRARRSKAVQGLLAHLEGMKGRDAGGADEAGTEAGPVGGVGAWDEEDERQLWLLKLEHAAIDTLSMRELLQQEQQLLAFAEQRGAQRGERGGQRGENGGPASTSGRAEEAARAAMKEKLLGIAGALSGGDRERMKQEVFRPSHILPTLTVEQQGMIERQQMLENAARQQAAEQREAARTAAQNSDEEDEEAVQKARKWDDFKDDHPYGSGNSALRPTA